MLIFTRGFFNGLKSDEMCVLPNVSRNTTILEKYIGMHGKSCCCRLLKCSNFCMQVTCDASWNQLKICLSTISLIVKIILIVVDVLLLRMESCHGAMTNLEFRWETYSIISSSEKRNLKNRPSQKESNLNPKKWE